MGYPDIKIPLSGKHDFEIQFSDYNTVKILFPPSSEINSKTLSRVIEGLNIEISEIGDEIRDYNAKPSLGDLWTHIRTDANIFQSGVSDKRLLKVLIKMGEVVLAYSSIDLDCDIVFTYTEEGFRYWRDEFNDVYKLTLDLVMAQWKKNMSSVSRVVGFLPNVARKVSRVSWLLSAVSSIVSVVSADVRFYSVAFLVLTVVFYLGFTWLSRNILGKFSSGPV